MATLDALTVKSRELYDLMVEAHKQTAEVLALHIKDTKLWNAAGRPVRAVGPREALVAADGYFVLRPMQSREVERYLEEQMRAIRFVGMSLDDTITISQDRFEHYTVPKYRFKEENNG